MLLCSTQTMGSNMKRILSSLVLAALLTTAGAASATATSAQPASDRCTLADAQLWAHNPFRVTELLTTEPTGSDSLRARAEHIAQNCQFRFYDDRYPHVFSEEDYFVGGVNLYYQNDPPSKLDHQEATWALNSVTDRLFWGPSSVADSELQELPLIVGPIRSVDLFFEGPAIGNHRYIIFAPGSQEPGEYQWRWEQSHPTEEPLVTHGIVIITPGSQ